METPYSRIREWLRIRKRIPMGPRIQVHVIHALKDWDKVLDDED